MTNQDLSTETSPTRRVFSPGWLILWALFLLGVCFFYGQCLETQIIGFIEDDGIYTVLGKALAEGKGYRLLQLIGEPVHVKYPPVYPLLLSLGWLINPEFPANIPLLATLTLTFPILAIALCIPYLHQVKKVPLWIAFIIAGMVAGNYFLIYYTTALMSEGLYLFFSLLTLYFLEKQSTRTLFTGKTIILAIVFSVLTFYTRAIGLSLILGIGLFLLLKRQFRPALIYTGLSLLLTILPWMLWGKWHTPSPMAELEKPFLRPFLNYAAEWSVNWTEGVYWETLLNSTSSFIFRLTETLFPVVPHLKGTQITLNESVTPYGIFVLLFTYGMLGIFLIQITEQVRKQQKEPSASACYLLCYCAFLLFWNYGDQMARFQTVLLPWFWYYLFRPFLSQPLSVKRIQVWVLLLFTALSASMMAYGYNYIHRVRSEHWVDIGEFPELWGEYQATFNFIRKLPPQTSIGTEWDTVIYLYTQHPTYRIHPSAIEMHHGEYQVQSLHTLLKSLYAHHVSYLMVEPHMEGHEIKAPVNLVAAELLNRFPNAFKEAYTSPQGMIQLYQLQPDLPKTPNPKGQPQ